VRHPITFSQTPAAYRLPPPALDEHGGEIRRWLAGDGASHHEKPSEQENGT